MTLEIDVATPRSASPTSPMLAVLASASGRCLRGMVESMHTNLRRMVKRILRKYGYSPDKQEKATLTILEQAELIAKDWAE